MDRKKISGMFNDLCKIYNIKNPRLHYRVMFSYRYILDKFIYLTDMGYDMYTSSEWDEFVDVLDDRALYVVKMKL